MLSTYVELIMLTQWGTSSNPFYPIVNAKRKLHPFLLGSEFKQRSQKNFATWHLTDIILMKMIELFRTRWRKSSVCSVSPSVGGPH